ncbi:MAG TPA: hypothetical protein PLJ71_04940 [Candidatus Hydrogenedentes bacterium]|nr:hypothetical protein [Candidatus Hydrogenedentota bacterium]HQM48010.1 hypothetical protein [Candidatus Hydrogenedentota bacterium]
MAKRLDFEAALLRDLQRKRRKRPAVRLPWVFALLLVSAALAASASALLTLFSGNSHAPIAETAANFASRLAGNQMQAAAELCPEGALGAQLVAAERARAFLPEAVALPQSAPGALENRIAQLSRVREDLERAGLDWNNARMLAFGGVSARVFDPVRMQQPSAAVIGNIYIGDGKGVYTIEVSLMNCLGSYVITDLWQWGALDIVPEAVKSHSRAHFEQFKNEKTEDGVEIKSPEHVFLKP